MYALVDCTEAAGTQLKDDLRGRYEYNAREFKFGKASKSQLVRHTSKVLSEEATMYSCSQLRDEFRLYGEEKGTFGAVSGHDDVVTAAMLYHEVVRRCA